MKEQEREGEGEKGTGEKKKHPGDTFQIAEGKKRQSHEKEQKRKSA